MVVSDRLESGDSRSKLKKEKLVLTSKVLDLAAKLLKELEGPNKVCFKGGGWCISGFFFLRIFLTSFFSGNRRFHIRRFLICDIGTGLQAGLFLKKST